VSNAQCGVEILVVTPDTNCVLDSGKQVNIVNFAKVNGLECVVVSQSRWLGKD